MLSLSRCTHTGGRACKHAMPAQLVTRVTMLAWPEPGSSARPKPQLAHKSRPTPCIAHDDGPQAGRQALWGLDHARGSDDGQGPHPEAHYH